MNQIYLKVGYNKCVSGYSSTSDSKIRSMNISISRARSNKYGSISMGRTGVYTNSWSWVKEFKYSHSIGSRRSYSTSKSKDNDH